MAKKRRKSVTPTIDTQLKLFQEVMDRSGVEVYIKLNNNLLTTVKGISIVINVQPMLWEKLMSRTEFKNRCLDADMTTESGRLAVDILEYGSKLGGEDWLPLNGMELYDGNVIPIHLDGYTYDAPVSKDTIPLKFRKAEFTDFFYKLFHTKNGLVLAVQKRFLPMIEVPLSGFTVASFYHIV